MAHRIARRIGGGGPDRRRLAQAVGDTALIGAGTMIPKQAPVLLSLADKDKENPENMDLKAGGNQRSVKDRFDSSRYLSAHSDIVSLLVLEHQVRMHNLITRVSYEARVALEQQASMNKALGRPDGEWSDSTRRRIQNPAEVLLQYMLFADEAPLRGKVEGTSTFAADFARQGPRDQQGRSLRQFDLEKRLFRYPCSFLVYTKAFDELPAAVKDHLHRRLWEVLSGADRSKPFATLSAADRQAVKEILTSTKPELAASFARLDATRLQSGNR